MLLPVARVGLVVCTLLISSLPARAQPGATGPIADLNAQAKALSETNPDESMRVAQQALAAARKAGDIRGQAEALNYIAYGYRNQSQLGLARQNAFESLQLFVQAKDPWGEAQGYNTIGLIEADNGRFPEALEAHLKALAIRERTGDREGLAYSYNNIGNIQRNMGQYKEALEYHQRGLEIKVALGMRSSEAYSHHNMGLVYFAMKDYPNAVAAYRRAHAIREELKDPRGVAVCLNAIGQVEAVTNPAAALDTFRQTLVLRRETGDERGEMATEINIGDVYRRMGDLVQATAAYNRALDLGNRLDVPLMRSRAFKAIADVEASRGAFESAYYHMVQYEETRERMFSQENTARVQRLQLAHETERQQRQVQALEIEAALRDAELARVRTVQTALAAVALLVIVSLALLYARYRLKRQSEARLRAQADALAEALGRIQTMRGLLPICAWCKKIRDDQGYWTQVETYVASHSHAEFTHSICPTCYDTVSMEDPTPSRA